MYTKEDERKFMEQCLLNHVKEFEYEYLKVHTPHITKILYGDAPWTPCPCVTCYRQRRDNGKERPA